MSLEDNNSKIESTFWRGLCVGPTMKNGEQVLNAHNVIPLEFINQPDAAQKAISCVIGGGGNNGRGATPGQILVAGDLVMVYAAGEQSGVVMNKIPGTTPVEEGGDGYGSGSFPLLSDMVDTLKTGELPEGIKKTQLKITPGKEYLRDINNQDAINSIIQSFRDNRGDISAGTRKIVEKAHKTMKNVLRQEQRQGSPGKHKILPKSIGSHSTQKGSVTDPTSFIKNLLGKQGEMISGAQEMMEKIKAAGAAGKTISASDAVGGVSKWQNALASIANKQASQQNQQKDEDDYLCELFRELFPDFPCRIDDIETEQFRKWKREYLAALENTS